MRRARTAGVHETPDLYLIASHAALRNAEERLFDIEIVSDQDRRRRVYRRNGGEQLTAIRSDRTGHCRRVSIRKGAAELVIR